ncbi:MAG: exonuclease subunit SbcD [Kiritimatiellae bacterium]|nr:exonuclease subunit SbcD [Kiritimatiellia bacterium]
MKIIHTSDWHLGARLHEEDRSAEHQAFLDWLIALMREEKPDALIVAGDVFDVKAPSPQAQKLYYEFLARVVREHLCSRVVVTAGNHDNAKMLAAPSRLLEELGVVVVSVAGGGVDAVNEVVAVDGDDGRPGLVVAAVPFMFDAELANFGLENADETADRPARILAGWRRHYEEVIAAARKAAPNVPLVATGHCTVRDALASDADSERCRHIGGIDAYDPAPLAAADYVALGHLHIPQPVGGFEGKMFYSGSPLRMSFDEETSKKSVNIVTLGAHGTAPTVEIREVPETVPILTVEGTPDEAKARLAALVAESKDTRRYVRVRLRDFEGEAKEHWAACHALVKDSATLILEENDMRPIVRETKGLRAFAGTGIRQLRPREVAERKLRGSNRHFSDEQVAEFMAMYDEVAGGVA